jgi:hypothetical protein
MLAPRTFVISSPDLGVFAVAADCVLCAFPARWTYYLNTVSAAGPATIPSAATGIMISLDRN